MNNQVPSREFDLMSSVPSPSAPPSWRAESFFVGIATGAMTGGVCLCTAAGVVLYRLRAPLRIAQLVLGAGLWGGAVLGGVVGALSAVRAKRESRLRAGALGGVVGGLVFSGATIGLAMLLHNTVVSWVRAEVDDGPVK